MATDLRAATDFYDTFRGAVAGRLVRARIAALWPDLTGCAVLGIGRAGPYLSAWEGRAHRLIALSPAQSPLAPRWPPDAPSASCAAEEDALPFPDLTFDRVLLVHGLEVADNARRMLRETWRVLRDDGRLLVVVPNRAGMWAYWESTPFGDGHPYSASQLDRLLSEALFRVERRDAALWVPPLRARLVLRAAPLFERTGRRLMPGLAGVTLAEAVKDVYAAVPLHSPARRRLVRVEAA